MAREQVMLRSADGVAALVCDWYDFTIEQFQAEKVASAAVADEVGLWQHHTGCLDAGCWTMGGTLIWLKSRLSDFGFMPKPGGVDAPFYYLPPKLPDQTREQWEAKVKEAERLHLERMEKEHYARSRISRSVLSTIEPIDRVASRLVHLEGREHCPYCRKFFRNNAALRLHVVESHGVTA